MTFIEKVGGSSYYFSTESMGSYGTEPGHPNRKGSIVEKRGGRETGCSSIEYVARDERDTYFKKYTPKVFAFCDKLMREWEERKGATQWK